MPNICVTVAYDGSAYHGFQDQGDDLPTIQRSLERAIVSLTGEHVRINGAGRTDAGVHAYGQVVNFTTQATIPVDRWALALNSRLPKDIVVRNAIEAPTSFHARFSATCKTYRYTIDNGTYRDVFHRHYAYHIREPLDITAMAAAAELFIGTHNFQAFRSTGSTPTSPVRNVISASMRREEQLIHFYVCADGFLYNMVRIMVGTLIDVGKHKRSCADVTMALQTGLRELAGNTAPPQGLCLMQVEYPGYAEEHSQAWAKHED
jgi:tRNA pseudouridine38-40 synthase